MGHINNIEKSFILDSGATISVINSEQVINSSNSLIETKNIRVHRANGSILKITRHSDGCSKLGVEAWSRARAGVENEAADALSRCPVAPNTVDEESLENNIHDPPAIRPGVSGETSGVFGNLSGVSGGSGVGVTQCGAIQPKKDDRNVTLQVVREWQQNDPNIQEIVAELSGDGARFGRLRKLYVIRDRMLHRHPRSIVNGEEGVVVPADKVQI
ncbi:hypothetical protein QTP88_010956 [Uroleucon formosanum]